MRTSIGIALAVGSATLALAGAGLWYLFNRPLYTPGMVHQQKNLRSPLTVPAQPGDPDYWQVESDIKLFHFSHGQGRNVLVVHGGAGVPFRQPLAGLESLCDRYRFHYYDQRGSGRSSRPIDHFDSPNVYKNMKTLDQTLGLGAQIADIERIRRILGEEKLILIGHSWGGLLSALYAAEFPEHVESLVLISPATALVMPQEGPDLFTAIRQRLPAQRQPEFDAFMKDYLDFRRLFTRTDADLVELNRRFGRYFFEVASSPIPQAGELGGWMVWGMFVSMGRRHDFRPALQAVTAPVLVLHGAQDLLPETSAREYANLLPRAQLVVIEGAGHFSFAEQPSRFAEVVSPFLAGQLPAPRPAAGTR